MCGICGILNFDSEMTVRQPEIDRMVNQLLHRGPDDSGVWLDERIALGHVRLAVIDLSKAANQPMSNEDGSIWITCNGEVYNFFELRKKLESKGHRFRSRSDTEVIIHLYEEEGIDCVDHLRGMFAFAIWDENKKQLLLARDRMGQKPLYYYEDREKLLFASEIKGILASGLVKKSPDYGALYQYLCLGYVPHPKTGFENINKLSPGHRLVISGSNIVLEPYWSLDKDFNQSEVLDESETSQRLIDLLMEATRIRMVSDVPLGGLLSGGIDSNAVVAMMSRCAGQVKTFTIGFEDKLYDERKEARFLANRLETDHHEMVVRPDIIDILPKIVRAYDEPFADPSAIPSYYVAQMARQHVKVVLNGDGGDENFAGYGTYIQGIVGSWAEKIPQNLGRILSKILCQKKPGKFQSLAQVLALSGKSQAWIFNSLKLIAPLIQVNSLLSEDFRKMVQEIDAIGHLVELYESFDRGDHINTMLAVDLKTFLPDDLLFKIDIATMSHGLEARSPFLDHHLVEFAAALPGNLKLKGINKKYILKLALKDLIPTEIIERPKRGFDVPVSSWLRGELRDIAYDMLLNNSASQQLFKEHGLETLLRDHCSGKQDFGRLIWTLLMLEMWWREFFGDQIHET
ncbi:MAG: asparagine synthase (glutamine-hydrolyzing) [Deltaproteobacteria bacterium]|nr:asparagine synthase (glutamine-hydrolyzing) [Deltaproteobacteria bacterium]